MAEMEDRWLSVDEISKHLGVSSDTVYRWIEKHSMPAHRMGRLRNLSMKMRHLQQQFTVAPVRYLVTPVC